MSSKSSVAETVSRHPVMAVVRAPSVDLARRQCEELVSAGIRLLEITFSVPEAAVLTHEMVASCPPEVCVGMGTVTTEARALEAVAAGSSFIVSPNCSPSVAAVAKQAERYLVLGSLTPTEIVAAYELGADLVKVYPLPFVGGADYLRMVRGPLFDIPMLAGGGFPISEIAAYREAGAIAFGMGPPLLGRDAAETKQLVQGALGFARGKLESGA